MKTFNKRWTIFVLCLVTSLTLPPAQPVALQPNHTARLQKPASLPRSRPEQQGISSSDILGFVEAAQNEFGVIEPLWFVFYVPFVAD